MAKLFLILALVAIAYAKPWGIGGVGIGSSSVVSSNTQHSSHVGHSLGLGGLGLGYGIGGVIGYPGVGLVGQSISSHSISHAHHHVPHIGIGGLYKGYYGGLYPGGIGLGYGMIG
ncbi:unnamed protein product [Orchesella dallaii]|uniref:Uncharacterized protein n=1 Tax=Orchesella dallaii TaxID=48710 RepID=A0ABP1Q805_9HEXA